MKRRGFFVCFFLLSLFVFSEQESEQALVINIEVPVRVYKNGNFIDNLTIDDFEIREEGIPQRIEAVYLIKKKTIERSEERNRFVPSTERTFFLFFEISEYSAEIGKAIDYFHENVIKGKSKWKASRPKG